MLITERRLARRPHRAPGCRPLHGRARSPRRPTTPTCPAVEVNIRRVVERVAGRRLSTRDAEEAMVDASGDPCAAATGCSRSWTSARSLCRPRDPRCGECPLTRRCATRGALADEAPAPRAGPVRGHRSVSGAATCMARLRDGPVPVSELDADALASLVATASPSVAARSPRSRPRSPTACDAQPRLLWLSVTCWSCRLPRGRGSSRAGRGPTR